MERKPLHLALTGFVLLWFAVIVPGHQRGVLRLPGGEPMLSCCAKAGRLTVEHGERPRQAPAEPTSPGRDCAICQFTMTLDAPPLPDLFTPVSAPVEVLPVERTGRNWVEPTIDTWRRRGPPA